MLCTTNYLNDKEVSNQYAVYLEYRKVVIHAALGIYFTLYPPGSLEQDMLRYPGGEYLNWVYYLVPAARSTKLLD